ncbi:AAA family ATPase [Candidatus Collierbacteria bacterium]|nr:AAA family ATPase [Candidatus Collierbacteria bacterium]
MEKERFSELSGPEVLEMGRRVDQAIQTEIFKVVYGPELQALTDILILAIFTDSHVVVRAPVGLAKTLACSAMAQTIGGTFNKRQFRPDMLPSELSGFEIFNQQTQAFEVRHGPLFGANVFLADEINRGTPKAQAALLEAMEERHLTVGNNVYQLEPVFLVLATRNPMEHEGTYQLPEAQLDRFLAQPIIRDITEETGLSVLSDPDFWRSASKRLQRVNQVTTPEEIVAIREAIFTNIHIEPRLDSYIWRLRDATWKHELVAYGSSPRGAINLKKAAMAAAFRAGRSYAIPEDIQRYAVDILAHRIFLKPEVRYDENAKSPAGVIREVLNAVKPD